MLNTSRSEKGKDMNRKKKSILSVICCMSLIFSLIAGISGVGEKGQDRARAKSRSAVSQEEINSFFGDSAILGHSVGLGLKYYFEKNGAMKTGWLTEGKKKYYFESSGVMKTGWLQLGGKWYFLNPTGGFMVTGWRFIGGTAMYYFDSVSGEMLTDQWIQGYKLDADGRWTYPYQARWGGNSKKGWWFGDETGWYAKSTTLVIDKKRYTFDKAGYTK